MVPTSQQAAAGEQPSAAAPATDVALRVTGLDKSFGAVQVLRNASLVVRHGTIHALLGGNGSGKSTTIKILAGVYQADAGRLEIRGQGYDLAGYTPATAERSGLRFVHQDLGLFDDLSVEENFAFDAGFPRTSGGRIDWKTLRARVAELMRAYGIHGTPRTPVNRLRPADRTLVAIARALQDDAAGDCVVVLDEPTASLGKKESEELLGHVRRRADLGQTFVVVSHRMQEVLSVAQDFTVFRDGAVVGELVDAQPTEDEIVAIMAGRSVTALRPTGSISHATNDTVLEFRQIAAGPLTGVDLAVHRGEIVGIAGLAGSGRSTLLSVAFGDRAPDSGQMLLDGRPYAPRSIGAAMAAGVALVPEDRAHEAAFADLTTDENLSMSVLGRLWHGGLLRKRESRANARALIEKFGVHVAGPDALFSSMSGGNQQKVVLARWLQRDPQVILLDEPTQGVDVMSRADIYAVIRDAAATIGACVLIASSDIGELHALCDRVVVLGGGRIVHEVAARDVDVDDLTALVLKAPSAPGDVGAGTITEGALS
ncbi:monosaccharide ABC transporter ATP-binding protein, CUT2 family [Jatrophihabitans endophyticus]|uniref:Monosaccharide ABC transporter ATP-binding protein, CUT2 family n=1 Tax=Jatrophihabitans endophyticus TaxID=1206085 RepID=A0A1M5RRP2_9ACTN|nr:sugar ABC transporter ATP-binding protein [Jatrophihabitans endophyticus]SHH28483.1 monosaccharide ABC transporter ATP-binding protein, CUT2 family [Jatrophihabitans endophyticus]